MKLFSILENVKQSKDLLNKLGVDYTNNKDYQEIRKMLSGNDGYTLWFVKQRFQNNTPMDELKNIWNIFQNERSTIQKFSKPISKLETIEDFWDEYFIQKNLSKARNAYKKFLPEQRKLLDFNDEQDRNLLDELSKNKEADKYFYNKSKRYHKKEDLVNAIKLFLQGKSTSTFDDLLKSLRNDNQDIRFSSKENDIIVICVDYNSLRKWGSDTSWCIVPSEKTFNNYNTGPFSQQFIIFLTDESGVKSKIGLTSDINGYRTAHYKNDSYCDKKSLESILKDRDVNIEIIYPNKEEIRKIKSWNNFSVEVLKNIGFSNDEILSKKSLFNTNKTKGDLKFFTKEEIEKYKLLRIIHGKTSTMKKEITIINTF